MKLLLITLLFISSCAGIQKATNVNILADEQEKYQKLVRTFTTEDQAKSCQFMKTVKAEDNILHPGKENAILNIMKHANDEGGNAIWVQECKSTSTIINASNVCTGKIYNCKN